MEKRTECLKDGKLYVVIGVDAWDIDKFPVRVKKDQYASGVKKEEPKEGLSCFVGREKLPTESRSMMIPLWSEGTYGNKML